MKYIYLLFFLIIILPSSSLAIDKSNLAGELFSIRFNEDSVDHILDHYWPYFVADIVKESNITNEIRAELDRLKNEYRTILNEKLLSGDFKSKVITTYVNIYTEEELSALVAFYRTTVGNSALNKYPEVYENISSNLELEFNNNLNLINNNIKDIILLIKLEEKGDSKLKADYYADKKQYIQAIKEYRKAIQENPGNPDILNNLAWILATCPKNLCSDPKQAIYLAHSALKIKEAPYILDTLAVAYSEMGDFSKATEILRDIISKNEKYEISERELGHYVNCLSAYQRNISCINN